MAQRQPDHRSTPSLAGRLFLSRPGLCPGRWQRSAGRVLAGSTLVPYRELVITSHPRCPAISLTLLADQTLTSGSAVRLINADLAGTNDTGRVAAEIPRRLRTLVDPAGRLARRPSCWPVVARAPNCAPDCPAPSRRWLAPHRPSSSAAPAITSSMSPSPTLCRAKSTCRRQRAGRLRPRSQSAGRRRLRRPSLSSWKPATSPRPTARDHRRAAQLIPDSPRNHK